MNWECFSRPYPAPASNEWCSATPNDDCYEFKFHQHAHRNICGCNCCRRKINWKCTKERHFHKSKKECDKFALTVNADTYDEWGWYPRRSPCGCNCCFFRRPSDYTRWNPRDDDNSMLAASRAQPRGGLPGPRGLEGPVGEPGDVGKNGTVGHQGPVGEAGPAGEDGRPGAPGDRGIRGDRGRDGRSRIDPPKVDCLWGPWSAWQDCSASCGPGHKRRDRSIRVQAEDEGLPCVGLTFQLSDCHVAACDGDDVDDDAPPPVKVFGGLQDLPPTTATSSSLWSPRRTPTPRRRSPRCPRRASCRAPARARRAARHPVALAGCPWRFRP
eukprot:SRR837773.14946.p1 GENE.SRR837773.14946~~SRR837773.14946.p1  ORF type:complete len:336 (-),score=53.58 SRR837773.14946:25-1005(-)